MTFSKNRGKPIKIIISKHRYLCFSCKLFNFFTIIHKLSHEMVLGKCNNCKSRWWFKEEE